MNKSNAPLLTTAVLATAMLAAPLTVQAGERIKIASVLITLIEQVEVPAREAGELAKMYVREGQLVKENMVLAQIDDKEANLTVQRAAFERDIAAIEAKNDIQVRFSLKSKEVALAELKRALESIEKYRKSVSETELDRLRLTAQRSALEVEQAQHDLKQAALAKKLKENDFEIALRRLERRKVVSSIDGMVVQIHRRRGEWVEPGQTVIRIIRINRLRAEGLLDVRDVRDDLTGRRVTLSVVLPGGASVAFRGKIVFVSPEVSPVSGQVRIWAEIDNPKLTLRPGLNASMVIESDDATAAPK